MDISQTHKRDEGSTKKPKIYPRPDLHTRQTRNGYPNPDFYIRAFGVAHHTMSQQRMALWAAEEIDEDLQDVDLSLAIGNYGQNGMYDDGLCRFRHC
jgi:hypothetical protein